MKMKYYDLNWNHDNDDDPIRLVSEIGADGYEKRKLEFFRDGSVGYASEIESSDTTMLGVNRMPKLEDILAQPDFSGAEITAAQFEGFWREHVLERR